MLSPELYSARKCHLWSRSSEFNKPAVMLRSSKAVDEGAPKLSGGFGRPVPDPRRGPAVELCGGDCGGAVDLRSVGEGLPDQGLAAEQPPPGLLEVQPAG